MSLELLERAKADRAWLMDCMSDDQEEEFRDWLTLRTSVLSDYENTCWNRNLDMLPTKRLIDRPIAVSLASASYARYEERLDVEIEETCLQNRFLLSLSTKEQK